MKTVIVVIFIVSIILFNSCFSGELPDRKVFNSIEIGMTIKEVKNILGDPDKISITFDSSTYYFYLIKNDLIAKKYASVKFDKEGWVIFKSFGNSD